MVEKVERVRPEGEPVAESAVAERHASRLGVISGGRRLGRWILAHGSDLVFLLLSLALFVAVAVDAFTLRMATGTPTGDFWEHSATLRALLEDPWHPSNPHLASSDPSPRFIPLFVFAALVGRAFNLDVLDGMALVALLHTVVFLAGIFFFFRTYFRTPRASLYGLVVMFGSWLYAWHFSNVYQLSIFFSVASYPSTAALGISLLAFTQTTRLLRGSARERYGLPLLGVCVALLLVTHALTAMLGLTGVGLLCLTEPRVAWKRRLRVLAAITLGVLVAEAWPYFSTLSVLRGGPHEETSWVMELVESSGADESGRKHMFYKQKDLLLALGYALIGVPVSLLLLILRRHLFIVLGAIVMVTPFIVNYYVALPLGHRFILLTVFYLQAALVWALLNVPELVARCFRSVARVWPRRIATLCVFAFLGWMSYPHLTRAQTRFEKTAQRHPRGQSPTLRTAREIARAAGKEAIILADEGTSWSIPTFGPKVVSVLHDNPLIRDPQRRRAAVRYFFSGRRNDRRREELIQTFGVTHVVVRRSQEQRLRDFLSERGARRPLRGGVVMYTLEPGANRAQNSRALE